MKDKEGRTQRHTSLRWMGEEGDKGSMRETAAGSLWIVTYRRDRAIQIENLVQSCVVGLVEIQKTITT